MRSRAETLCCGASGIVESWPMRCRCLFIMSAAVLTIPMIALLALVSVLIEMDGPSVPLHVLLW